MILVVGATGKVGSEVCRPLKKTGKPLRAVVRSTAAEDSVRALEQLGVEMGETSKSFGIRPTSVAEYAHTVAAQVSS